MRLTAILFRNPRMQGRQPSKEKFFDRLPIFRLTSMTFGRSRNCWSLARPSFEKGLVQGAWGRKMKPMYNRMLRITRLEGGLSPFGLTYESFVENLAKMNVLLNKKVLADFAMYEPRTFKSIVSLVQKKKDMDNETTIKDKATRPFPTDLVLGKKFLDF